MSLRIMVVDNHGIMRQGITALVEKHNGIEVVGEAEDGKEAVEMARELLPDIILMDVTMPRLNGIEATRQIKGELSSTKILALSIHANREFVLDMIMAGVSGYILKECVFDELVRAIKIVATGQSYLSPSVASIVLNDITKDSVSTVDNHISNTLTPRELQILQLLAEGISAKQIASQMKLSIKTIESNRRQIMEKTKVNNLADLTKYAIRKGLTTVY